MGKLSIGKAVTATAKKTAGAAGKIAKSGTKHAIKAGKSIMTLQLPSSLNWIYSFGFKVGIFLILKSFLILRYQFFNLQLSGFIMIVSQFLQALVLIACGALMQNESLFDEPIKLRKISHYYGYALLLGLGIFAFREIFAWEFFKEAASVNWFVDFFHSVGKGASEIGLSLLFWDCDLWGAFCGLLYFITTVYLHISFDYASGFWARVFDKVHFLRESHQTAEIAENEALDEAG